MLVEELLNDPKFLKDVREVKAQFFPSHNSSQPRSKGTFSIPRETPWDWTETADLPTLERICGDAPTRGKVYETIALYIRVTTQKARSQNKSQKTLPSFKMSSTEYSRLMSALRRYASNQILYCWKSASNRLPRTTLVRQTKLEATATAQQLMIHDPFDKSTTYFKPDNSFLNTTAITPYLMLFIGNTYDKCRKILNLEQPGEKALGAQDMS